MAFNIVIGGVVRHVMYCTYPGQVSTNKRDYQLTSLSGGSFIASGPVIAKLDTDVSARFKACMTADAAYYGSQLYYQTPVGPKPRPDNWTLNTGAGYDVGEALPLQTSGLISLYSDTLGKAGQGRLYVPFPSIDSQGTDSTPDNLYLVDLNNFGTTLSTNNVVIAGGVTATFTPVLYIPGGSAPLPIVRYVARDGWATQRRRGNFGRPNSNPF